jgi:hypothetical protein
MNAQVKDIALPVSAAWMKQVRAYTRGTQRIGGRNVGGYMLSNERGGQLAFIETLRPMPRIEELLDGYVEPPAYFTARQLMRTLLNAEDYRSEIYDVIVRVHYVEDFEAV